MSALLNTLDRWSALANWPCLVGASLGVVLVLVLVWVYCYVRFERQRTQIDQERGEE